MEERIYSNQLVETLLAQFRLHLGVDYDKYRNHVYRVFLNCLLLDSNKVNEDKYAIAAVFHDIGIWTNHTIDYLDPSIDQACIYLRETGKHDWIAEITGMINWHHKMSPYHGKYEQTIESFRKADWMDVTFGLVNFGMDRRKIKDNRKEILNRGFHLFLAKKIIKNLLRHPLHPLPMFKK